MVSPSLELFSARTHFSHPQRGQHWSIGFQGINPVVSHQSISCGRPILLNSSSFVERFFPCVQVVSRFPPFFLAGEAWWLCTYEGGTFFAITLAHMVWGGTRSYFVLRNLRYRVTVVSLPPRETSCQTRLSARRDPHSALRTEQRPPLPLLPRGNLWGLCLRSPLPSVLTDSL